MVRDDTHLTLGGEKHGWQGARATEGPAIVFFDKAYTVASVLRAW